MMGWSDTDRVCDHVVRLSSRPPTPRTSFKPCLPRRPPRLEPRPLKTVTDGVIVHGDAVVTATDPTPPEPPGAVAISLRRPQTNLYLIQPARRPQKPPPSPPAALPTTRMSLRPSAGYAPNLSSITPYPHATTGRATCVRCGCERCTRSSSVRFAR